jgi:predicted DCC family thiol-disulfide oxidoreductase YuxK
VRPPRASVRLALMEAAAKGAEAVTPGNTVVLFDGVCAVCNRAVRFLLARDRKDKFRYAPLQSAFAAQAAARHGRDARDLDSLYVIADYGTPSERFYAKAEGILHLIDEIGGAWRLAGALRLLPAHLLDWGYDTFVKNRYRWFGKYDSCPIPTAEERAKFIVDA